MHCKNTSIITVTSIAVFFQGMLGAGAQTNEASIAARAADEALERGSEASPDPWVAVNSAQLFSRPTVGEKLKIGLETGAEDSLISASIMPFTLLANRVEVLDGLQFLGSYGMTSTTASFGLKYSYSFRNNFSSEDLDRIIGICEQQNLGPDDCEKAEDEALDTLQNGRWAFSIGAGGSYSFVSETLPKWAVNASADTIFFQQLTVILNADLESTAQATSDRRLTAGGGATVGYAIEAWDNHPIELAVTAKLLACASGCGEDSSVIRFGPRISVGLTKETVLAGALSWEGTGSRLDDAIGSIALAHSFGVDPASN